MGCKQTTIKPPLPVAITSPPASTYVKSALKKSHPNGQGKTEKLSFSKRKMPPINKSVNFDEKVQVKSRTPTPRQTEHEKSSPTKIFKRQISDDHDDDDGQTSPISSLDEEVQNNQTSGSTAPSLQRTSSNAFWQKKNSIGVKNPTNVNKENTQLPPINIQQPPVNNTSNAADNLIVVPGNRFKIRRKIQYSALSQTSTTDIPISSPSPPVQRSLPNTNTILLEHRAPLSDGVSSPKTTYYAFSRRPIDNGTSTNK